MVACAIFSTTSGGGAPTRVGARAVVAAVGCTVRAGRRGRCHRRSSASSVRCRGPGNAESHRVRREWRDHGGDGGCRIVGVHTCSHPWGPNVRTRGAQTENHRSNRGIPLVHHVRTIDRSDVSAVLGAERERESFAT